MPRFALDLTLTVEADSYDHAVSLADAAAETLLPHLSALDYVVSSQVTGGNTDPIPTPSN